MQNIWVVHIFKKNAVPLCYKFIGCYSSIERADAGAAEALELYPSGDWLHTVHIVPLDGMIDFPEKTV
jgi:hypothetical protein